MYFPALIWRNVRDFQLNYKKHHSLKMKENFDYIRDFDRYMRFRLKASYITPSFPPLRRIKSIDHLGNQWNVVLFEITNDNGKWDFTYVQYH